MLKTVTFLLLLILVTFNLNAQYFLDSTFGLNGMANFGFGGPGETNSDMPFDIITQSDGNIITAGQSDGPNGIFVAIARLFPGGQLDTSGFGVDGRVYTHFVVRDRAYAISLQSDGKIIAVGNEAESNAGSAIMPSIYRFNSDGSTDTTFAGTGYVALRFDAVSSGSFYGVYIQPDGKILAAGSETGNANGGSYGFGTMRFLPTGELDTTYGVMGKSAITCNILYNWVGSVLSPDGGIIMASTGYDGNYKYFLAKMDNLGNRDTTFGINGIAELATQNNYSTILAITDDGKILMGGTTYSTDSHWQMTVFRFLSDGTLDSAFAAGGRIDMRFTSDDYLNDLIVDQEGKILVAGETGNYGVVARLTSDGNLDTTFASEGRIIQSLNNNSGTSYFTSLILLSDESVLTVGFDFASGAGNFVVSKFNNAVTNVADNSIVPVNFVLNQNYPNPFNPSTKINFILPSESRVKLNIYNMLGEKVRKLFDNDQMSAGEHTIEFSAGNLASGIYIYSIEAQTLTGNILLRMAKKMILLK
ncbi:MAG TPA: T9SS type A sorting domain-containing protein [Ignavibacteriaceae bacterium]|nr:T9SS type A sorting domain-containing protein [Ignavibacteriaceae bacterium]